MGVILTLDTGEMQDTRMNAIISGIVYACLN